MSTSAIAYSLALEKPFAREGGSTEDEEYLANIEEYLGYAGKKDDLALFYGLISTIVPFGANLSISSISWSVTAIHPCVQSTPV